MKLLKSFAFGQNTQIGLAIIFNIFKLIIVSTYKIVAVILIVLKLSGVINLSWIWVLSPLYITWSIGLIIIFILYCKIKK